MISLETAMLLKSAGLKWVPRLHDLFAIPERGLDDRVFVISDVQVTVEKLSGTQVVSFQGASEWALDYLVTTEAVWLPGEHQLRQVVEQLLLERSLGGVSLTGSLGKYTCRIPTGEDHRSFEADDASEAYAGAVYYLLRAQRKPEKQQ